MGLDNAIGCKQNLAPNDSPTFQSIFLSSPVPSSSLLENSGITPATYGDASHVGIIAFNAQGVATSASNIAVQIAESQVTGLVSDLAKTPKVYDGTTGVTTPIVVCLTGTTTTGALTVHPTVDGTTGTASLFPTKIMTALVSGVRNTTTAIQYALGSVQSISADRKTIILNVGNGANLLSLGNTIVNVPDGTTVDVIIHGY